MLNEIVNSKSAEQNGKELYKNNDNYRHLLNIMEHPEFKPLWKTYFSNVTSTMNVIMFMKLYDALDSKASMNPYEKLSIINEMIKDSDTRGEIVSKLKLWVEDKTSLGM